jgi:hypothetical protein
MRQTITITKEDIKEMDDAGGPWKWYLKKLQEKYGKDDQD